MLATRLAMSTKLSTGTAVRDASVQRPTAPASAALYRSFCNRPPSAASRKGTIDPALIHSKPGVDNIQPGWLGAILLAFLFAGGVPMCIYLISTSLAK